jgi:hypothetical protein
LARDYALSRAKHPMRLERQPAAQLDDTLSAGG